MSTWPTRFRLVSTALIILLVITLSSCEERYQPPGIQAPTNYTPGPELVWEEQARDPDDVDCISYVIGDNFHYSTKAWQSDDGQLFVIGNRPCYYRHDCNAYILQNDGEQWLFPGFTYPGIHFTGIWGSSADDVYVTGWNGIILHFDGESWSQEYTGYNEDLTAVWGSGPDDVYAVGDSGIILHNDGTAWKLSTYTGDDLIDIWGQSPEAIYTISRNKLYQSDGQVWSEILLESNYYFRCVWASPQNDLYIGTHRNVLRFDGELWNEVCTWCQVTNIRGTSGSDIYVVCQNMDPYIWPSSHHLGHFDGTSWSFVQLYDYHSGLHPPYLWGNNATGIHYLHYPDIMGLDFPLTHRNEFEEEPTPEYRCVYDLQSIWGSSDEDIFATDWRGNVIHYDGEFWSLMESPVSEVLHEVWGTRADDVFAVGTSGTIIHYNGFEWQQMNTGSTNDLYAVWGSEGDDVFAVGDNGIVLHFDGHEWQQTWSAGVTLRAIWGSGQNDIYIGGDSHTFYHYDGDDWDWVDYDDLESISDIWGSSSKDVYFVGRPGTIVHYDGEEWRYTDTDYACGGFRAIGGTLDGKVYALTECRYTNGCLLYLKDGRWLPERSMAISSFKDIWISQSGAVYGVGTNRRYPYGANVLVGRWE